MPSTASDRGRPSVKRRARQILGDLVRDACAPTPSASVTAAARDDAEVSDGEEISSGHARRPLDEASRERSIDLDALTSALTCAITNAPFVDPVTTPCGHTFERDALARWLTRAESERAMSRDRALSIASAPASCPQCRSALYHELPHEWPVNTTVRACVEAAFGKDAARAARSERAREGSGRGVERCEDEAWTSEDKVVPLVGPSHELPVFFLDALVPGQEVTLNVFESKYKVLIRRCLMGSRKFLMTSNEDVSEDEFVEMFNPDYEGSLDVSAALEEGCKAMGVNLERFGRFCAECQIVTCQELVDGRFLVRVRAMRHVYVHGAVSDPAGYCVARCTRVRDEVSSTQGAADVYRNAESVKIRLQLRVERVTTLFDIWIAMTSGPRWLYNYGGRMSSLLQSVGSKPDKDHASELGWWFIRALNPLPTIDGTIEMRSICMNAWNIDVRLSVIAQMLAYSLALVQRIAVKNWVKSEHATAVALCDALYDELESDESLPVLLGGGIGRSTSNPDDVASQVRTLERLFTLAETGDPLGKTVLEMARVISHYSESEVESHTGATPSFVDAMLRERGSDLENLGSTNVARAWAFESDRPTGELTEALACLILTYGPGALALACWRQLSSLDPKSKHLAATNERLLRCLASLASDPSRAPRDVNALFQISSSFGEHLRRDMRFGIYKVLYIYDLAKLLTYLCYRLVVVFVFALGFLFEVIFDREFQGGRYTVARGVLMAIALGGSMGLYTRYTFNGFLGVWFG